MASTTSYPSDNPGERQRQAVEFLSGGKITEQPSAPVAQTGQRLDVSAYQLAGTHTVNASGGSLYGNRFVVQEAGEDHPGIACAEPDEEYLEVQRVDARGRLLDRPW